MIGRQAWKHLEQEAESSHLQPQTQTERANWKWSEALSSQSLPSPRWHTSISKPAHLQTVPLTGDEVFNCVNLYGTFLTQVITGALPASAIIGRCWYSGPMAADNTCDGSDHEYFMR